MADPPDHAPMKELLSLRPQRLILLLALLAPYDGLLVIAGLPGLANGWKEGLVLLAVGIAFVRREPLRPPQPPWAAPALVFTVAIGISVILHPGLLSLVGAKVVLFYLLVPVTLRWAPLHTGDRDHLVTILMFNGVVTASVGVLQQLVGHESLNAIGYPYNEVIRFSNGWMRSFSTFNQPFPFAFFLAAVLLIGIPVALEQQRRMRSWLFLASTPLLVVAMMLSFVRGAVVGLVVGLVVLSATRYRQLWHGLFVVPILITGLFLVGGSAAFFSTSSLGERSAGWTEVLTQQGIEPLGVGIGSTGSAAERAEDIETARFDRPEGQTYQPDNYYIKILVELGPIGLWIFLAVIILALSFSWRVARATSTTDDKALALGILASTMGAAAAATVSTYWEIFPADLFFWLFLGVSSSIDHQSFSTHSSSRPEGAASTPTVTTSFKP